MPQEPQPIIEVPYPYFGLSNISHFLSISIVDGRSCPLRAQGHTSTTLNHKIEHVLYILNLSDNLLDISIITREISCSLTFYHFYGIFQDLWTGKLTGMACEKGKGVYVPMHDDLPSSLNSSTSTIEPSFLWYHHLSPQNI